MNINEKLVLDFLGSNRVGALSVQLKDASPHAAALHYSHVENPTKIFFFTDINSKKCEALVGGNAVPASFVVGFNEADMKTLQMNGSIRLVSDSSELEIIKEVHFKKNPKAAEYKDDPDSAYLEFTPAWWRYTDYKSSPETIITSE